MSTIAYDRPVKDLIDELSATGHVSHKTYRKTSVTFHHNGGRLSHEGVLKVWQTRPASAHFDVDRAGAVAQYVKINEYAWAVGNMLGNQRTISIEMANAALGPDWLVSETTWRSAARLAGWIFAKVIGERPSSKNFFRHKHWTATTCAGPCIDEVWNLIMLEAQAAYDHFRHQKSNKQIASEVWAGKWGSGEDRTMRLKAAGYDPQVIQNLVNRGVGKSASVTQRKSVSQIADEVLAGKWGNGSTRVKRLIAAGYNAKAVQDAVNQKLR